MSKQSFSLLHCLRTMSDAYRRDARNDAELIERFVATRDETAVATLAVRHGPMVWEICRRILGNDADAEDAYQVTFLALAKKAAKIRVTDTVAGWLCQVARQSALNGRKAKRTRQKLQQQLHTKNSLERSSEERSLESDETYSILYEELAKLSEKQRLVLVLHYLEGRTQAEVAEILHVGESAVWDRLMRGKNMLQRRLAHRGLTLGTAALGAVLGQASSHGAMPMGLVAKTVQAATAVRDGELTGGLARLAAETLRQAPAAAPWWKAGWIIAVLCVSGLGAGVGGVAWRAGFFGTKSNEPSPAATRQKASKEEKQPQSHGRLDRYGDSLPPGALARLGTTRFRRASENQPLLFTHDGKALVTCNAGSAACICDAATGQVLRKFGKDVRAAALSRDGRIMAGRSPDDQGGLCVWDVATGKLLRQINVGNFDYSASVAIAPDAKSVAAAGSKSITGVWEISTGNLLWEKQKSDDAHMLAYSSDGKELFDFCGAEIFVWKAAAGKELRQFGKKENRQIIACAYSPNSHRAVIAYLATGARQNKQPTAEIEICSWDAAAGRELHQFRIPRTALGGTGLALSPDGGIVAITDSDQGLIRFWDAATGKEHVSCGSKKYEFAMGGLAFSPNGKTIAAGIAHYGLVADFSVHLWDVESGKDITPPYDGHAGPVASIVFTGDPGEIVSSGSDGEFRVWDPATGAERRRWGRPGDSCCRLSAIGSIAPDGEKAVLVERSRLQENMKAVTMRIVRRAGKHDEEICRVSAPTKYDFWAEYFLSCSSDKKTFAWSTSGEKEVHLLDMSSGKELRSFPGEKMAFSPDGKILAIARNAEGGLLNQDAGVVHLWELSSNKLLCSFQAVDNANIHEVRSLAFSPDMRLLAVTSTDGKIRLWPLSEYGREILSAGICKILDVQYNGSASRSPGALCAALTFSPDARILAASHTYNVIHVWETATGQERDRFDGHEGEVLCLAFSPEGRRLASGSRDASILTWDVTGGNLDPAGKMIPSRLNAHDAIKLWDDLISADARRAARSIWSLAAAGTPAVSILEQRLARIPRPLMDGKRVAECIANLDAEAFAVRDQARRQLAALGKNIEPELRQAMRNQISLEKRQALKQLLEAAKEEYVRAFFQGAKGEELRAIRAVEVLGHIGTPPARKLLEELAAGSPTAPRTQAAKVALRSLRR